MLHLHKKEAVDAAIKELYTGEYFAEEVASNKDFLEGKVVRDFHSVEDRLRILVLLIEDKANKILAKHDIAAPKGIFTIYAYSTVGDEKEADRVTISVRNVIGEGDIIKIKEQFDFNEKFLENSMNFIHTYVLKVLDTVVARDNIDVLNSITSLIAEQADTTLAFSIGFAHSEVPVVKLAPDAITFGVGTFDAQHVLPDSRFADVLAVRNRNVEEAKLAAEELAKAEAEVAATIEVEEVPGEETVAEVEGQEVDEVIEEVEEDLLTRFLPTDEPAEEEAAQTELEALTPEERKELASKRYLETVTTYSAQTFIDSLLETWVSSSNPLEFIHSFNADFFQVVAGNVTKTRCNKVVPLLKESFRLSDKTLKTRKSGSGLITREDGEVTYAKVLTKHEGEVIETYPEFNTATFK